MASKLFQKKSPDLLIRESEMPERKMKRSLTALDLTLPRHRRDHRHGHFCADWHGGGGRTTRSRLFDLEDAGPEFRALAGSRIPTLVLGRAGAGPAVVISFVVAAIACGFAALCYAELASMIPVSGSAYTYSYATLGELIAWIIGWDLILEYAVGNMAVAASWSGYFVKLCGSLFGLKISPLGRDRSQDGRRCHR